MQIFSIVKSFATFVMSGNMPARTILRANILLAVDRNGKQPMTVQEAAIAQLVEQRTFYSVFRYATILWCSRLFSGGSCI